MRVTATDIRLGRDRTMMKIKVLVLARMLASILRTTAWAEHERVLRLSGEKQSRPMGRYPG